MTTTGAAAGTLAAPVVADALKRAGVDGALATSITALASTAAGALAGGTAGAAAGFNEVVNNYLNHPDAAKRAALKDKQRKGQTLSAAEQRTLDDLEVLDIATDLAFRGACTVQGDACNVARRELNAALGTYSGAAAMTDPRLSQAGNAGVNAEKNQILVLNSDPRLASQTLLDSLSEFAGPQLAGYAIGGVLGAYVNEARAIYAGIKSGLSAAPSVGASGGTAITNDVLAGTRVGNGTKGQGSGNKVDQLPTQQVVGADGKPIPVYELKPNGPYAAQEFPSTPIAHGFPNIVDNYASSATQFPLNNGASLYQAAGSYNGVAGRFEWIVDPKLGGATHRMFVPNGSINGIPVKP